MNLELLPNEILLVIFEYFNDIKLFFIFYGLNPCFNFLLYKQYRGYYFRFDGRLKRNFDMIYQQHLSFITDRIIDLRITDDEDTSEQTSVFLPLSLYNVPSYEILMKIIGECHHSSNLTH